jgi:DNA-binding LacI/PurR family transcriptional regulator
MPYVNRWFFAEVLEGIQQALLARGLDLTLYDAKPGTEGRDRIFDDFLARKRFDGSSPSVSSRSTTSSSG